MGRPRGIAIAVRVRSPSLRDRLLPTFSLPRSKGITIQKSSITKGTGRTLIANNIAFANGFSGVHLNEADNVDIIANTVVNNHHTGSGSNVGISISDGSNNAIKNNIVVSNNTFGGKALNIVGTGATTTIISNNAITGVIDTAGITVSNTVFGDPKFAAWSVASTALPTTTADFHLLAGSPALNVGASVAEVTTDYAGVARGSPPDLGALERVV